MRTINLYVVLAGAALPTLVALAPAQERPGQRTPAIVSPEVSAEKKITFRVRAPKAEAVRLVGSDIPGTGQVVAMKKGKEDVWEASVGPVPSGAYRYHFNIDGVAVIDPRNPATSESNNNTWSLVYVPGSDISDTKKVPHGAVAAVTYYSESLKRFRRMHVYTPPGYENSESKFPVFYLLHGASDSVGGKRYRRARGDAWPSLLPWAHASPHLTPPAVRLAFFRSVVYYCFGICKIAVIIQ